MTKNVGKKFGKGLSPKQFVEAMTKNQDKFQEWSNRFQWAEHKNVEFFQTLETQPSKLHCFILAADWCGDVIRNVPVVFHVLERANIPVEVLIMEENLDVMDEFLTMGGRSIPIVLFTNQAGDVVGQWGPRPKYIQEPMVGFKQKYTDKTSPEYEENLKKAREEVIRRYGDGTEYQSLIVQELREILEQA